MPQFAQEVIQTPSHTPEVRDVQGQAFEIGHLGYRVEFFTTMATPRLCVVLHYATGLVVSHFQTTDLSDGIAKFRATILSGERSMSEVLQFTRTAQPINTRTH